MLPNRLKMTNGIFTSHNSLNNFKEKTLKPQNMDVLFLAFSNSQEHRLQNLEKEEEEVYRHLAPRALQQQFMLHRESYATIPKIHEYLVLYRKNLSIFLYSGHAGKDKLLLNDTPALSDGIA